MDAARKAAPSTRDRMIEEARSLFAERGFYGVSIAQIAAELGLTKQALLHHFGTKERLYGMVLAQIADELAALRGAVPAGIDPAGQLRTWLAAMVSDTPPRIERSRLLMREILDNRARAESAGSWYLRPFLEELVAMLRGVPGWAKATDAHLLATVVQLLGAINYHAVAGPTFRGIFGKDAEDSMNAAFGTQLRNMVDAVLKAGPPATASPVDDGYFR